MAFKKLIPRITLAYRGFRYDGQMIAFSRRGFMEVYDYNYAFVETNDKDKFRLTLLKENAPGAFRIRFPVAGACISTKTKMTKGRYLQNKKDPCIFTLQ